MPYISIDTGKEARRTLTQPIVAEIRTAITYLSNCCDGARTLDGAGFNKMDAGRGKSLASQSLWTEKQVLFAYSILRKYQRQLERAGIALSPTTHTTCCHLQERYHA
jgi:hypothetical protein